MNDGEAKKNAAALMETIGKHKETLFTGLRKGDGSIWYGPAGNLLANLAMYRLTQKALFSDAADFWVEKTLEVATATGETSAAGYGRVFDFPEHYKSELSVMTGIYGIALTLLSYLHISDLGFGEFIYLI
jgi:hypothetical protein